MNYQLTEGPAIKLTKDNGEVWWIAPDLANTMYQDYLAWLVEDNTPTPAES